ncbi:MAG: ATP-grasp fold amidoligase family protein [Devosia sp.]
MGRTRRLLAGLLPVPNVILRHWRGTGRFPNVWNPQTLNEKIAYRKLHDRSATLVDLSDKVLVKDYVARTIGARYVTPTLWHGTVLPADAGTRWPPPFVLKCNYGAGRNIFVRPGTEPNWPAIRRRVANWLSIPYRSDENETWYERVLAQVLVEPLIAATPLVDYRFLTFSGRVESIYVHHPGRPATVTFFDRLWNRLEVAYCGHPQNLGQLPPPTHLAEMIEAAERLAKGLAFVRVDFYDLSEGPRFGELTFSPNAGNGRFSPSGYDAYLGALWTGPLVEPV